MSNEDNAKETPGNECPVCYERLQNPGTAERRLSCGHSFCHDCLVKYLVTAKKEGSIKKNIICPLCRYVTFLTNRGLILPPRTGELNQILEVPVTPSSCLRHTPSLLRNPNTLVIPITETSESDSPHLSRCTCLGDTNLDSANHAYGSQVFVISDQGQPMYNEDVIAPTLTQHVDARVHCCRSPSIIMVLLLIFLVAVMAAVLPWILLVKKV
ncbi:RING finger protein 222 [Rana temporaria]|uniref:RING finger protein 222 n=1 Tax=Rana temporaria TaxID=8407 RepID=UPI001AAC768A|nr:RING finger protein 222 [Rana temporaria]